MGYCAKIQIISHVEYSQMQPLFPATNRKLDMPTNLANKNHSIYFYLKKKKKPLQPAVCAGGIANVNVHKHLCRPFQYPNMC